MNRRSRREKLRGTPEERSAAQESRLKSRLVQPLWTNPAQTGEMILLLSFWSLSFRFSFSFCHAMGEASSSSEGVVS